VVTRVFYCSWFLAVNIITPMGSFAHDIRIATEFRHHGYSETLLIVGFFCMISVCHQMDP